MTQQNTHLLDWPEAVRLAGNNPALAKELLQLFLDQLPHSIAEIKLSYQEQRYADLKNTLHKLIGGCSYCGLSTLRKVTREFETALRRAEGAECRHLYEQFITIATSVTQLQLKEYL